MLTVRAVWNLHTQTIYGDLKKVVEVSGNTYYHLEINVCHFLFVCLFLNDPKPAPIPKKKINSCLVFQLRTYCLSVLVASPIVLWSFIHSLYQPFLPVCIYLTFFNSFTLLHLFIFIVCLVYIVFMSFLVFSIGMPILSIPNIEFFQVR